MEEPATFDVRLTPDQALVLFGFLERLMETKDLNVWTSDEAEKSAVGDLFGLLQLVLDEPDEPNYEELLEQARQRLRTP